eukprot:640992-Pyramimonas_sp.AAC.1
MSSAYMRALVTAKLRLDVRVGLSGVSCFPRSVSLHVTMGVLGCVGSLDQPGSNGRKVSTGGKTVLLYGEPSTAAYIEVSESFARHSGRVRR